MMMNRDFYGLGHGDIILQMTVAVCESEGEKHFHPFWKVNNKLADRIDDFDIAHILLSIINEMTGGAVVNLIAAGYSTVIAEETDIETEVHNLLKDMGGNGND